MSPLTQIILVPGGGAIARVDEDADRVRPAHAPRGTSTTSRCGPTRPTPTTNIAYTRELAAAMKPWTTGRAYLNFIGDEGAGRVEAAVRRGEVRPPAELKRTWDPTNLFRHNQNIPPAS